MKNATMLYRCPGDELFEGVRCETITVEAEDVAAHLDAGWSRNWMDADAAHKDAAAKLKANEEEQKALAALSGGLHAVHKGRGVYEVQDADGNVVESGLTKEEAQAKAGG